nr:beta-lactamase family protein [Anaerolineae bacterium]
MYSSIINTYIQNKEIRGAALAVAQHGKQVIEHYAGEAAPGLPSGPDVLWTLASISKLYTAAMVMRLVEEGKLTLNRRVCDVIPQFIGGHRHEVRLRHLLTHTSGLIYESPEMEARLKAHTSLDDMMREAYTAPLLFRPGTEQRYGDYNYLIAAAMAQTVMNTPFPQLVQQYVIAPAGLSETFMPPPQREFGRISKTIGGLAEGTSGAMYNSDYALSLAHPAFGTVASVNDLLRFGLLFAPSGLPIHSRHTLAAMTKDQTSGYATGGDEFLAGLPPNAPISWGLGFAIQTPSLPAMLCDCLLYTS